MKTLPQQSLRWHARAKPLEEAGPRMPLQSTKPDPLAVAPANDADQQFPQVPEESGAAAR